MNAALLLLLLLLLVSILPSCENQLSDHSCQKSQRAFRNSCFEFPPLQLPFLGAQSWCEARGGHLAFIPDEDAQSFLQGLLDPVKDTWIGLTVTSQRNDSFDKGGVSWLDGSPVVYSKWMERPPPEAQCGHILRNSDFQWAASSDCRQKLPFVCQFEFGTTIVCAGFNATLQCGSGRVVMIGRSFYGRESLHYCRSSDSPRVTSPHGCGWLDVTTATAARCDGRRSCLIADIMRSFGERCAELRSYMSVEHRCEEGLTLSTNSTAAVLSHVSIRTKLHPRSAQGLFHCQLDTGDNRINHFYLQGGLEKSIVHRYTGPGTFNVKAKCSLGEVHVMAQTVITVEEAVAQVDVISCYAGKQSFSANNCKGLRGAGLLVQMEVKSGSGVACRIQKEGMLLSALNVTQVKGPQNLTVSEEKVEQLGLGCHRLTLYASNMVTIPASSRDLQVCILEEISGLQASVVTDGESCSSSAYISLRVWLSKGAPAKLLFRLVGSSSSFYETRDMNTTRGVFHLPQRSQGPFHVNIKAWNEFSEEAVDVFASCGTDSTAKRAAHARVARSPLTITATNSESGGAGQNIILSLNNQSELGGLKYEWRCSPCACQELSNELVQVITEPCLPAAFEFYKYSFKQYEAGKEDEASESSICITLTAILDISSISIDCIQGCDPMEENNAVILKMTCLLCQDVNDVVGTELLTKCPTCQDFTWYTENPDDESTWPEETRSCYESAGRRPLIDKQAGQEEYRVKDSTLELAKSKERNVTVVIISGLVTPLYTTYTIETQTAKKDPKESESNEIDFKKGSQEEDSKEKDSKEEDSKEKDSKEEDSKEKDSKENDSKEKDSKENDSKEKDSKEEDSKEKDSKENDSKEKDSKEEDSKEKDSKENDSKENDSKENDSKENDSKENDSKENDSKENDSKENDSKENDSKENDSKENDSKENDSKENDSKENDSKENDSKEKDSKENDSKENDSKENDSKENDSKENDSKENDSKENDSKENDFKENDSKVNDSKVNDSKENDPKEKDPIVNDSKVNDSKENDPKEKDPIVNNSTVNDSKVNHSIVNHSIVNHPIVNHSIVNHSKVNHSIVNHSKVNHSIVNHSIVNDSKVNHSIVNDSKVNHSKVNDSKEKDPKEDDSNGSEVTLSCNFEPKSGTFLDAFDITCSIKGNVPQSKYCIKLSGEYIHCSNDSPLTSVYLPLGAEGSSCSVEVVVVELEGGKELANTSFTVQVTKDADPKKKLDDVIAQLTNGTDLLRFIKSAATSLTNEMDQKSEEAKEEASSMFEALSASMIPMNNSNKEEVNKMSRVLVEGIDTMFSHSDNEKVSRALIGSLNNIQNALLLFNEDDDGPTIITKGGVCLLVERVAEQRFNTTHPVDILNNSCAAFYLPPLPDSMLPSSESVAVKMFSVNKNIYGWRKKGQINGTVGDLTLLARNGSALSVENLSEDISIYLPRPDGEESIPSVLDLGNYSTVTLDIPSPNDTLVLKMMPSVDNLPFKVFLNYLGDDNQTTVVASTTMPQEGATPEEKYTWLLPQEILKGRVGPHSVFVRPIVGPGIKSIQATLDFTTLMASCKFWKPELLDWSENGCRVGSNTTPSAIHCLCNHLTAFGGSFFVTPNLVDPSRSAELFANFADNPVVVCFVGALFILYFLVLIWARRKDIKDTSKVNVTVLQDNNPLDRYCYLLNVNTGHRIGASTTSQVTITLLGSEAKSESHHLTDPKKQVFQRGALDMFLLCTPFSLGELQAIRVWHNNSGDSPDWFVGTITVQDLQTEQKWHFLCNCWLSVDLDDCSLDKLVPVSSETDLKKFSHLFFLRTTRDFSDGHLWLSVVARPPSSTFTCVQRVSCCFSLLLCTMLTSIMFYGIPTDPSEQTLDLGHFEFTWQQFMVGVQSSLIMFPINIIIVTIFRSTRPRETPCCQCKKKKLRTLDQIVNASPAPPVNAEDKITLDIIIKDIKRLSSSLNKTPQSDTTSTAPELGPAEENDINATLSVMEDAITRNFEANQSGQEVIVLQDGDAAVCPVTAEQTEKKSNKTRCLLNQLSHIEAELLLLGPESFPTAKSYAQALERVSRMKTLLQNQLDECNLHSISAKQADEKKQKKKCCHGGLPWWFVIFGWLLVMASSVVSGYFTMLYGLKFGKERSISWLVSMIISFFQSLLFIQPVICFAIFFALVIKKVEDEGDDQEVLLNENVGDVKDGRNIRRETGVYQPPPLADIEKMKRNRILEQKAFALFREIFIYLGFMWMLLLVAYGQRDANAYFLNQHIRTSFHSNTHSSMSLGDVFTWANTTLITNLFATTEGHAGFITDGNSKLLGNARLRQLRVHNDSCQLSGYVNELVPDCHAPYSWDTEDKGSYEPSLYQEFKNNVSGNSFSPWVYQTQEQLGAHPIWGKLAVYRGGGFAVEIGPNLGNASSILEYLFQNKWLDVYTRALIVEFTVYNANVNLFCMVTLLLETAAVGAFQLHSEQQSIRLYQSTGGLHVFVMAGEILYLLFILYYMVVQGKLMRQQRWAYLSNTWNLVELSIILLTWAAVAFFIMRTVFGNQDVEFYQNNKDKFVNFSKTASADVVLQYLIAFVVLLATVKLWRLLRLNSNMNMLTATLQRASKDIASYLVVIFIMLLAYSVTCNVIYGWEIASYKTLPDALMTILNLQVGMFNYSEVLDNTSLLGASLFGSCIIFMTYVVINLFISVILVAFNEEQLHHKPSEEEEVVEVMMSKLFGLFGIRYKSDQQRPEADASSSGDGKAP